MSQLFKKYIREYRHKKILKTINIPLNGVVLDLSCADGQFLNHLHNTSPNLKLFGVDISNEDIKKAIREFSFINFSTQNATILNFENNTFDFIFSLMSLHHYKNPEKVFKEISRTLKTNGTLYLVDLITKYTWTQKIYNWKGCPEPYHFEKYYSIEDLEKILKPFNLHIIKNQKITFFPNVQLINIIKKT